VKKLVVALGVISALALFASPASALPPSGALAAVAGAVDEAQPLQQVYFVCRHGRYWCRGRINGYCCVGESCGSYRCHGVSGYTRRYY
jgi:hypothetical protein